MTAYSFSLATPGGERRVLTFKGNAVTTTDASARLQAEKQGDEWSIGINDYEFYTIPEAVIRGGSAAPAASPGYGSDRRAVGAISHAPWLGHSPGGQ